MKLIKLLIIIIISSALGFFVGMLGFKYSSEAVKTSYVPDEIVYERLFELHSVEITEENFYCESFKDRKVGNVLSMILKANSNNHLNRVHESCSDNICVISYNGCKSWQSDGCGSTMLRFDLAPSGEIDTSSFQCLQIP